MTGEAPVVVFEAEPWQIEHLRRALPGVPCRQADGPLNERTVDQMGDASVVSVFTRSQVCRAVIERMNGVGLIATRSTGFDHIDLVTCHELGIAVPNVPVYGENTVAEHTFSLILALSRRLAVAVRRTEYGDLRAGPCRSPTTEPPCLALRVGHRPRSPARDGRFLGCPPVRSRSPSSSSSWA